MSEFTSGSVPGFQAKQESEEKQVFWSGRQGQNLSATAKATLDGTNTDAGNTPATTLRGGQVLSVDDASGNAFLYSPDANNGRQIARGVLERAQDMLQGGAAADRFVQMVVAGLVRQAELIGLDPRARQQLAGRFLLDGQFGPVGVLMHPRGVYRKSANYTLTAADDGLLFVATAGATFTLPAKQNGLAFRFLQTADADLVIAGSSDLIHKGNASASSVTFSTSGQKIGSQALVECLYTAAGTLRWAVTNLGGTTASVA